MKHTALMCLACGGLALLPAAAEGGSPLDQLLNQAAPILAEDQAYHTTDGADEAAEPLTLTLESAVELALEQNAQVLEADTEVAIREAQAGQARARRRPQIKGQAAYNYIEELDQGIGRPRAQRLIGAEGYAPDKETFTTGLTVTQLIYAGGQVQAAVEASDYLAASEAWRRDALRAEIAWQTREAYHNALLAESLLEVAEAALAAFERHLKDSEALHREGVVTGFEVMRAKTETAARRADLESARAGLKLAHINLRRILALPQDQALRCDPALPWEPVAATTGDLAARARERRPELLALQQALSASGAQEKGVKGKYLPQAAASVKWQNVENGGRVMTDGWQLNIGAQWDLYLGGQRKHELSEVRARAEGLRVQLAEMERLVVADVNQATVRLGEASASMRAEKEAVALAEESVRLAELRYREGAGTQTEIIDTQLARTRAKTALAQAIRDYFVAYAALQRATNAAELAVDPVDPVD